jgi:voltage-dependent calcium channel alpha-2/delta-3
LYLYKTFFPSLVPGGTSELERAFELAFELLNSNQRTACQSIIVFITDGRDSDGESVRCGEGYYTRSGYVPGPICIYNWTKVWELTKARNELLVPKARIFSYLTIDDGEQLPGHLACENMGSFKKLHDGENLISKMSNYYEYLSSSTYTKELGLWTSPYIDSGGLGLTITFAVPAISKKNRKLIGVAAVDVTLEEIENLLTNQHWGDVYSFLINKHGEAIFHPSLAASVRQNVSI